MSSANGSGDGGRRKAAAARAEKTPKPKNLTFNGLKFKLPAVLPDTILFDMVEVEAQGSSPLPMFRMLRSILGQDQFGTLREAVETEAIPAEELDRFIESIFAKYGVTPGGTLGLANLLAERWPLLEADFQRYYGLDLREAVGLDSPRRLLTLVEGLPPDAAAFRDEQPAWTQQDELLATLIEVTDAWGRQIVAALVAVHGGKVRLPEPVRVQHPERPEAEPPEREITTDAAEIAAFFRTRVR